jgi:sulfur-carrier protein adenylyltransferase/sulfurtransferase
MDAWQGLVSRAEVDQGRWVLEGGETAEEALALAYGLEEGARRFYLDLAGRSEDEDTRQLFEALAAAEVRHEDRLWEAYGAPGGAADRGAFEAEAVPRAVEGGLTADQVLARAGVFPMTREAALDLALALETDSLDLYLRLALGVEGEGARDVFLAIAEEEKTHLRRLGELRGG